MDREHVIAALKKLSKVGFGYDLTESDKLACQVAAHEIEDLAAFSDMARDQAKKILGQSS